MSFYGPPRPTAAKAWVDRVSSRSDFRFTVRLWKGFTNGRNVTAEDEQLFKDGIGPLMEAGRLGALLIQFPWSFRNELDNRAYLRRLSGGRYFSGRARSRVFA